MTLPGIPVGTAYSALKDLFSWVRKLLSKPNLKVYFDEKETYHKAPDLGLNGRLGMFLHAMVKNAGRATATECRGLLAEIHEETKTGCFEPAKLFRNAVELHWAHEPLTCFAKDLEPEAKARLDVCFAHQGLALLHFFCEKSPRGIQTDFPPGRYKIRINVRSSNGARHSARFLVAFDGNFDRLYMEELNE